MGLAILLVFLAYLLIALGVVYGVARLARSNGRSPWRWGGLAALVMYLIPFWDWIPTVVVHRYYCHKEAGFWVYKTLEQWKAENPGVLETLVSHKRPPSIRQGNMKNYTDTYYLNTRFNWIRNKSGPILLNRWRWEDVLIDTKNNEILARNVGFSTGYGKIGGEPEFPKFWLHSDYCPQGGISDSRFGHFVELIIKSSGGNK